MWSLWINFSTKKGRNLSKPSVLSELGSAEGFAMSGIGCNFLYQLNVLVDAFLLVAISQKDTDIPKAV